MSFANVSLLRLASQAQGMTTMDDLPNEILSAIFQMVHFSSLCLLPKTPRRRAHPGSIYRYPQDRYCQQCRRHVAASGKLRCGNIRPTNTSDGEFICFSYQLSALESVSSRWRTISRGLSLLFVVFLDQEIETLESKIRHRSFETALDVVVTRRKFCDDYGAMDQAQEKLEAEQVMKVLSPVLSRCRTLHFETSYASSLPLISRHFARQLPHLCILKLRSRMNNYDCIPPIAGAKPRTEGKSHPDSFPSLNTVALDGNTFFDLCSIPSWQLQAKTLSLDKLAISNVTSSDMTIGILGKLICQIGWIRHLQLSNLRLPPGDEHPNFSGPQAIGLKVDNLTIVDQTNSEISAFTYATFGRSLCFLHLVRCTVPRTLDIPPVHHLRLEKPSSPLGGSDCVLRFCGKILEIIDCQDVSDDFLALVAKSYVLMHHIYLENCSGFTIEGLKQMIILRRHIAQVRRSAASRSRPGRFLNDKDDCNLDMLLEWDHDDDTLMLDLCYCRGCDLQCIPNRICRLVVVGHPEKLWDEDRQWFEEHVHSFSWQSS